LLTDGLAALALPELAEPAELPLDQDLRGPSTKIYAGQTINSTTIFQFSS
jgi:hypothetical protein